MDSKLQRLLRDPAWHALLLSVIVSAWMVYRDILINPDGIRYIESAQLFLDEGLKASYERYYWPFYSVLFALVSKLTFTSLETSAHILNTCFAGLLGYSYIRCVEEMGAGRRVAYAALVLLLINVSLNGYRDLIVRDMAYWACFSASMWMLLCLARTRLYRYALWFCAFSLLGTLFRIEGVAILLAGPLVLLWKTTNPWQDTKRVAAAILPAVLLLVSVFLAFKYAVPHASYESGAAIGRQADSSRLAEPLVYAKNVFNNIFGGLADRGRLLEQTVLPHGAKDFGTEGILAIILMAFVLKTIKAAGLVQFCLAGWGVMKTSIRHQLQNIAVPVWLMLINAGVLLAFVIVQLFLTPRYAIPLALIVNLFAAFALAQIFSGGVASKSLRRLRIVLALMLVYIFLDSITSFGVSKVYIRDAANWMNEHVPAGARLATNSEYLYYYTGRRSSRTFERVLGELNKTTLAGKLPDIRREDYDYVVFNVSHRQPGYAQRLADWVGSEPVKSFANERGDTMLVFQLGRFGQ